MSSNHGQSPSPADTTNTDRHRPVDPQGDLIGGQRSEGSVKLFFKGLGGAIKNPLVAAAAGLLAGATAVIAIVSSTQQPQPQAVANPDVANTRETSTPTLTPATVTVTADPSTTVAPTTTVSVSPHGADSSTDAEIAGVAYRSGLIANVDADTISLASSVTALTEGLTTQTNSGLPLTATSITVRGINEKGSAVSQQNLLCVDPAKPAVTTQSQAGVTCVKAIPMSSMNNPDIESIQVTADFGTPGTVATPIPELRQSVQIELG